MTAPALRRATYEDVLSAPEHLIAEVLDGTLYTRPIEGRLCLREQFRHVWLVDPIAETLAIYRHGGALWHRVAGHTGNVTVRAEPFEAIELPLRLLWEP